MSNEQIAATGAFNRAMFQLTLAQQAVFETACNRGSIGDAALPQIQAATEKFNAAIAALQGTGP